MGRWDREVLARMLNVDEGHPSDTDFELIYRKIDEGAVFAQFKGGELTFMYDSSNGHRMAMHRNFWKRLLHDIERGALRLHFEQGNVYQVRRP